MDLMKTLRSDAESETKAEHYPALDGIRGLAVLLVFLNHCLSLPPTSAVNRALNNVSTSGWIGVDLFFVLSGFLITGILLRAKGHPHYFRNFICRRALRIFPLYFFC